MTSGGLPPFGPPGQGSISLEQVIQNLNQGVQYLGRLISDLEGGKAQLWQPYSALLTSISGLTVAAGTLITGSGSQTVSALAPGSVEQILQMATATTEQWAYTAPEVAQGRLTLSSNTPVQTADVSAATNVFYTPYLGDRIRLWNGTFYDVLTFTQQTYALNSGAHISGKNYDFFAWNSSGSVQIVTGPAWSTDTSRGTGAGTTQISYQNGILTNTVQMSATSTSGGAATVPAGKGTYLGTFRATANGQTSVVMNPAGATGGGLPQLMLWNNYNRVLMKAHNFDNGSGYTYTSNTIRQARANTNNQVNFVSGLAEDSISVYTNILFNFTSNNGSIMEWGYGLDSTTNFDLGYFGYNPVANVFQNSAPVSGLESPQLGFHFISMNEASDGVHANQFGTNNTLPYFQGHLYVLFRM